MNRAREARAISRYAEPQGYLYEPNVAVLKAGGFRSVGTAFELLKVHQHSHRCDPSFPAASSAFRRWSGTMLPR